MEPVKKNQIIPLHIIAMSSDGTGLGRYENFAVFVPFTAVGDRITAQIVKVSKNYAYGILREITEKSPDRIENDCPAFLRCGGCSYRHISYEAELREKQNAVYHNILKFSGQTPEFSPILPSPVVDGYRNKAQYPVRRGESGEILIGFYAKRSHRIIPCDSCALQPEVFGQIAATVKEWMAENNVQPYEETTGNGTVRHLYLRISGNGSVMVCLVVNGSGLPKSESFVSAITHRYSSVKSIVLNINRQNSNVILGDTCKTLWGQDFIEDELCGLRFKISPLSFFQVNRLGAENLYRLAAEFADLQGDETLLDLYCGTGTIGLTMAKKARRLIGVEVVPDAVADAKENARKNGIENAEFLCADAAGAAEQLRDRGEHPDVVILDPPRKGSDRQTISAIADMRPQRVVYVSCDSATLARDLSVFAEFGYQAVKVQPVDMFPRTQHVETVCLLQRG